MFDAKAFVHNNPLLYRQQFANAMLLISKDAKREEEILYWFERIREREFNIINSDLEE